MQGQGSTWNSSQDTSRPVSSAQDPEWRQPGRGRGVSEQGFLGGLRVDCFQRKQTGPVYLQRTNQQFSSVYRGV